MAAYALLFPGQGSQVPGMGREIWAEFECARAVYAAADSTLGYSLSSLCFEGDAGQLQRTEVAQPAIAVTSLAALSALRYLLGGELAPTAVAGHSLGEYSAVIASGGLDLPAGIALVAERGRLMSVAAARRPGSMAAIIGLDHDACAALCRQAESAGVVVIANDNSREQQVISGDLAGVQAACALARAAGAKRVVPLTVSGAFHSPHMQPVAADLQLALARSGLTDATWPVIGNVDNRWLTGADELRPELALQLTSPVRWRPAMESAANAGITTFIELGCGNVLSGLARRLVPGAVTVAGTDPSSLEKAAAAIRSADAAPPA